MKITIKPINYEEAKQISKWIYKEPYSIYSMVESDECINELLDGSYFSALDTQNEIMGYFCFGDSAKVPVGNKYGVYDLKDFTDIGLGIKPDLCGKGTGGDFLKAGLDFAENKFGIRKFRLTVAAFNERAIKVYGKSGFKKISSFERLSEFGNTKFIVMNLEQ
jgi:Acetyltransferases, including N-acetylases of ribosomal proteins